MTKKNDEYPNKADYEPNVDRHMNDEENLDELPLSDPSESNATKVFRENETKTNGENQPSAFHENKDIENK